MLMPSIFGNDFMDDFFVFPQERKTTPTAKANLMQTDVKETETGYEVVIDLPGYSKENVNAELKDGYLIISATTSTNDEEKLKMASTFARSVTVVPAREVFM